MELLRTENSHFNDYFRIFFYIVIRLNMSIIRSSETSLNLHYPGASEQIAIQISNLTSQIRRKLSYDFKNVDRQLACFT